MLPSGSIMDCNAMQRTPDRWLAQFEVMKHDSMMVVAAEQVAVKYATQEVREALARMGPRVLVESVVGPAFSPSTLRHMWQKGPQGVPASSSRQQRRRALWQHA